MTTIAVKDGHLAGDHCISIGDTLVISNSPKVVRRHDGDMCGVAGSLSYGCAFIEWFLGGEKGDRPGGSSEERQPDRAIIVREDGSIEHYDNGDKHVAVITTPYYAIGSGRDIALGAMGGGLSAEEAVRIATVHDAYTRLPITVVKRDG